MKMTIVSYLHRAATSELIRFCLGALQVSLSLQMPGTLHLVWEWQMWIHFLSPEITLQCPFHQNIFMTLRFSNILIWVTQQ